MNSTKSVSKSVSKYVNNSDKSKAVFPYKEVNKGAVWANKLESCQISIVWEEEVVNKCINSTERSISIGQKGVRDLKPDIF